MIDQINSLSIHTSLPKDSFIEHYKEIHTLCKKIVRKWHYHSKALESSDLAQVAIIKVWLARQLLNGCNDIMGIVARIAINSCIDICKSRTNGQEFTDISSLNMNLQEDDISIYEDQVSFWKHDNIVLESCSANIDIQPMLSVLTQRQLLIIEKSFAIGNCQWEQSDESIANELGITRQTVITDRKKALEAMKSRMKQRSSKRIVA